MLVRLAAIENISIFPMSIASYGLTLSPFNEARWPCANPLLKAPQNSGSGPAATIGQRAAEQASWPRAYHPAVASSVSCRRPFKPAAASTHDDVRTRAPASCIIR
jgi:hypothetical protein